MLKRFPIWIFFAAACSACVMPVRESGQILIGDVSPEVRPRKNSLSGWSYVIDPGHGGAERGAPSAIGGNAGEADLNLAVSLLLGGMLEASGAEVHYTRTADVEVGDTFTTLREELSARSGIANRIKPDFFISVHHNSSTKADHNRIEMYYKLFTSRPSRELAWNMLREFGRLYPGIDSSLLAGNFAVLRGLEGEGVLAECCYISDTRLAPKIETLSLLKKEAAALYAGIVRYAESSVPQIVVRRESGAAHIKVRSRTKITRINWGWDGDYHSEDLKEVVGEIARRVPWPDTCFLTVSAVDAGGKVSSAVSARIRRSPGDSPPHLILASVETGIPEARHLGPSIMTVENTTLENTLRVIEWEAPRGVIVLERGGGRRITHYFRSATGKKWAAQLALRLKVSDIVAGSHYLLNHTSMPAVVVRAPEFSEAMYAEIFAWSREEFGGKSESESK